MSSDHLIREPDKTDIVEAGRFRLMDISSMLTIVYYENSIAQKNIPGLQIGIFLI